MSGTPVSIVNFARAESDRMLSDLAGRAGGVNHSGTTVIDYPGAGVEWPANTTIKYTEWGNPAIRITSSIGGPNSAIQYHVHAPDDLFVHAPEGSPDARFCGVPPPPF